ncbi:MAG: cache domain-containing protein [Syntrophobacteraceae bacterium]
MNTDERIEVRKSVQSAIGLYEKTGKETLLKEIADPRGRFVADDRYIFALDVNGTMAAHPIDPGLTGKNLMDRMDSDGNTFIRKIVNTAKTKGYGFADYRWHSPGSKDDLQKTVFFERVDGLILCSGFYRQEESFLDTFVKYFAYYGPC